MKLTFYFDVYPWSNPDLPGGIVASTNPIAKPTGAKRYAVVVEIPDPRQPDAILRGELIDPE
jgi:hypothetical protein